MCTLEASVRTHALFLQINFMSPSNHNQVQFSRSLLSFTYIFSLRQDLSPNSHLCTQYVSHATNLAQRGPPRGTTPPPAPVMDVLVTSIDRACVESATDVLGARPRARSVELRTALNGAVCAPVDTAQHIDGLGLPMDGSDPRGHSPGRP